MIYSARILESEVSVTRKGGNGWASCELGHQEFKRVFLDVQRCYTELPGSGGRNMLSPFTTGVYHGGLYT